MATYVPRKVPANWYKYDAQFSLELLYEYGKGIEDQLKSSIEDFRSKKETIELDSIPEEGLFRVVEVYRGLDDETWHLESVFEDYFPQLQRGGALISLYSFFENELDALCDLYIQGEGIPISQTDMKGKGIERSILFLEKIVGLPIDKNSDTWKELINIKKIRNQIVHERGKLIDKSGQKKGDVIKYVEDCPLLDGETEVLIKEGYLTHTLETFDLFFKDMDVLIQRRFSDQIAAKKAADA